MTCSMCFAGRHVRCTDKTMCGCNVCGAVNARRNAVRRSDVGDGTVSRPSGLTCRKRIPLHVLRCAQIMRQTGGSDREIGRALGLARSTVRDGLGRVAA